MGFFDKKKKEDTDKLKKKKKGALGILKDGSASLLSRIVALFQVIFFSVGIFLLPILIPLIATVFAFLLIMFGAVALLFYFDKEDEKLDALQIDWGKYDCTCQFLTAEELAKFKEGGFEALGIDSSTARSLNVSGGSVVGGDGGGSQGGVSADGLVIAKENGSEKDVALSWIDYTIHGYDGYTQPCSDSDLIINLAGDTRLVAPYSATKQEGTYQQETKTVAEAAKNPVVTMGWPTDKTGRKSAELHAYFDPASQGRLPVALGSGTLGAPNDNAKYYASDEQKEWLHTENRGKFVDIVTGDGTVVPCVLVDAKADIHTGYRTSKTQTADCPKKYGKYNLYYNPDDEGVHIVMTGGWDPFASMRWGVADYSIVEMYTMTKNEGYTCQETLKQYFISHGGLASVRVYNSGISAADAKANNPYAMSPSEAQQLVSSASTSTSSSTTTASLGSSTTSTSSSTTSGGSAGANFSGWTTLIDGDTAYVGYNGVTHDRISNSGTTPVGIWKLNTPFGQYQSESGFPSNYRYLDSENYWWKDDNSGISTTSTNSEHIGSRNKYGNTYQYCLDMGFNQKSYTSGKGSAIFLHCIGGVNNTAGCVAIPIEDMKTVLQNYVEGKSFIAVAQKGGFDSIKDSYGLNLSPTNYKVDSSKTGAVTFDITQFNIPSDAEMVVVIQSEVGRLNNGSPKDGLDRSKVTSPAKVWLFKKGGNSSTTVTKTTNASGTTTTTTTKKTTLNTKTASSSNSVSTTSNSAFPKYNLTDEQLTRLARQCYDEQGDSGEEGVKKEASQMCNLFEYHGGKCKWGGKKNTKLNQTMTQLDEFVDWSGWYAGTHGQGYKTSNLDKGNVASEVVEWVRDVVNNGNRVLPNYIDEHDSINDLQYAENKDGSHYSAGEIKNHKDWFISGETVIRQGAGVGAGEWIYYTFASMTNPNADPFGYYQSTYDNLKKAGKIIMPGDTSSSSGSSGGVTVETDNLIYADKQEIGLDPDWEFAKYSKTNSGKAVYYRATGGTPKNICIAVGAGHGTKGGADASKKTQSHPDGTPMVTSGTNSGNMSLGVSSGTSMTADGTPEAVVTLKMAKILKDNLLSAGYDVLMIRDGDDVQLDNIARTVISNNVADAYIALHVNADKASGNHFLFTMPPATNPSYKAMYPVSVHYQDSWDLSDAIIEGWKTTGCASDINPSSGYLPFDLTQTSYSTIPTLDIELIGNDDDYSDQTLTKRLKGVYEGINTFFQTHTPKNQAKRGSVSYTTTSGGDVTNTTNTVVSSNSGGNTLYSWIALNDPNKLRTHCTMAEEGFCGCFIPDYNCACHIFGGPDGILGTADDGRQAEGDGTTAQLGTEVTYQTDDRIEKAVQWAIDIANDADGQSHGYSNTIRNGPDYDCSSLVYNALKQAGFPVPSDTWTTDSMPEQLLAMGFEYVSCENTFDVNNLMRGDILWCDVGWKAHTVYGHTEIYVGESQLVGAHGKSNKTRPEQISVKATSNESLNGNWGYRGYFRYPLVAVQGGNNVVVGGLEGLNASQSAAILTARKVMLAMLESMKTYLPSNYNAGLLSEVNDPWYASANGGTCPSLPNVIVDGVDYGTIRPDCSGYISLVLKVLGGANSLNLDTSAIKGLTAVKLGADKFEVLPYSKDTVQAGDIVVARYAKGHTEMFMEFLDKPSCLSRVYSWGATGAVRNCFDPSTQQLRDVLIEYNHTRYNTWYQHIIRYIGSGTDMTTASSNVTTTTSNTSSTSTVSSEGS